MSKKIIRHIRTPFGKVIKWSFIGYNLLMLLWLLSYWVGLGDLINTSQDEYSQAGAAIGGMLGTGMVLMLWVLGVIILGIPTLLTKGDIYEYTEEEFKAEKLAKAEKDKKYRPYIIVGGILIALLLIFGGN